MTALKGDDDYSRRYRTSVDSYLMLVGAQPDATRRESQEEVDIEKRMAADIRMSLTTEAVAPANVWSIMDASCSSNVEHQDRLIEDEELRIVSENQHDVGSISDYKEDIGFFKQLGKDSQQKRGAKLYEWSSIRHVSIIHRQGLHAPPLIMNHVKDSRSYYKIQYAGNVEIGSETVPCLFVRRKRRQMKYRFSVDERVMCKRRNPTYVGKCKIKRSDADILYCVISVKSQPPIARITVTSKFGKQHHIRVQLSGQHSNWQEPDVSAQNFSGFVNTYLDPILTLRMEQSSRAVLEIRKSGPLIPQVNQALDYQSDLMVYFDYPLTIFVAAAISVIVDAQRRTQYGEKAIGA